MKNHRLDISRNWTSPQSVSCSCNTSSAVPAITILVNVRLREWRWTKKGGNWCASARSSIMAYLPKADCEAEQSYFRLAAKSGHGTHVVRCIQVCPPYLFKCGHRQARGTPDGRSKLFLADKSYCWRSSRRTEPKAKAGVALAGVAAQVLAVCNLGASDGCST